MEIKTKHGIGDVLLIFDDYNYVSFVAIVNGIKIDQCGVKYCISNTEQKMCCDSDCQIVVEPDEYHDNSDGEWTLSIVEKVGTLSKE